MQNAFSSLHILSILELFINNSIYEKRGINFKIDFLYKKYLHTLNITFKQINDVAQNDLIKKIINFLRDYFKDTS